MKWFAYLCLALFSCLAVFAVATVTLPIPPALVTIHPPLTYTDGTPVPTSDIDHYVITWSPASTDSPRGGSLMIQGGLSTTIAVPCGKTVFTAEAFTTATAYVPNTTSQAPPVIYDSGISCEPEAAQITVQ